MANTIVKPVSRAGGRFFLTRGDAARLAVSAIGLFIGRTVLFDMVNPVAAGFLASLMGTGLNFYITAVFLLMGIATKLHGIYLIRYLICVSLLCVINIFERQFLFLKKSLYFTVFAQGLSGALCMLIGGLSVAWLHVDSTMWLLPLAMFESALAFFLTLVLSKASAVLIAPKRKPMLSSEEMISLAILFGCIIAGASDIYIGVVSLRYFLCFYFILLAAYLGDGAVAAAAGMLTGLMLLLAGMGRWNASMAVVLSLAGLGGGLFKNQGKPYVLAGFAAVGFAAFYYLNKELLSMEVGYSASFAGMLFLITPWKFNFHITAQINPVMDNAQEYAAKIRGMAIERLEAFSDVFARLGHKFGEMAVEQGRLDKRDAAKLIDDIASEACDSCEKRALCWEENFYATYQFTFGLLEQCEKKGRAELVEADEGLKQRCIDLEGFINTTNSMFELCKTNLTWKNTLAESRELISQQLTGVSGVIKNLADEMDSSLRFKEDLEEKILLALARNNIEVDRVTVLESKSGRYEVNIRHQFYYDSKRWNRTVANLLNSVLKRSMQVDGGEKTQVYNTRFIEEKPLKVTCGAARLAKGRKGESGDSYSFMDLKSGHTLLVLSDGMGSGKKARDESAAAVDLLENFLESGFDKRLAIKIINSALVLNGGEESFATLDICTVDVYTGDTEFIKLGASSTYLLRDGKVFVVRSASLPIGMLKDVDMEISRKKLYHNDILVMVTDGVTDVSAADNKEDWVAGALRDCRYVNPQDIADYLLFEAQRLSDGEVGDDMTVLAARVWEKE
ncbi:MAG: stage II sporulation protein E [Clostridiales bacterium]|nr:stage II sporulation protein E [Clostridiales bacterium]